MGENVSTSARRSPSSPDQISSSRNSRLVDRQRGGNDGGDDSINAKGDMGLEGGEEGEGEGRHRVCHEEETKSDGLSSPQRRVWSSLDSLQCTVIGARMSHRKWRETKQQLI